MVEEVFWFNYLQGGGAVAGGAGVMGTGRCLSASCVGMWWEEMHMRDYGGGRWLSDTVVMPSPWLEAFSLVPSRGSSFLPGWRVSWGRWPPGDKSHLLLGQSQATVTRVEGGILNSDKMHSERRHLSHLRHR